MTSGGASPASCVNKVKKNFKQMKRRKLRETKKTMAAKGERFLQATNAPENRVPAAKMNSAPRGARYHPAPLPARPPVPVRGPDGASAK